MFHSNLVLLGFIALLAARTTPSPLTDPNQRIHELVKCSFDSGLNIEWRKQPLNDPNSKLQRVHGGIE